MDKNCTEANQIAGGGPAQPVSADNREFVRKMTVPQLLDLCGKRQWTVQIAPNGQMTTVRITGKGGKLLGRADSLHANEETFSMALLAASREPTELED